MRRTIGPFLVTGVVLIGGAAVVANPIVPPPVDIRVSASDLAVDGAGIDILDPGFLEQFGAGRPGWQNSVDTLETLLSGLVDRGSEITLEALSTSLATVIHVDPTLVLGVLAATPIGDLPITTPTADISETAVKVLRAITDITSSFGTAGVTFIQQLGMVPAMVADLAQQVQAGTMTPDEALRRLVAAPLSALRPVIDALVRNTPGLPEAGVIGTIADEVTGAATDIRNTIDPSAQQSPTSTSAEIAGSNKQSEVVPDADIPPAPSPDDEAAVDGEEADGEILVENPKPAARLNRPSSVRPDRVMKEIGDRVTRTIDDIGKTVKKLTSGNGQKPKTDTGNVDNAEPSDDSQSEG